jgi:hypothetical protein
MNTETIYFSSGDYGNFAVQIDGLSDLMSYLKEADTRLQKAMIEGLKKAASPVLNTARTYAHYIQDDGTYASSLSIASRKSGTQYVLKSDDPAAPVKEFANREATYIPSRSDKRTNARKMSSFPVGVPNRSYPPRVMVNAVNRNQETVLTNITTAINEVLEQA